MMERKSIKRNSGHSTNMQNGELPLTLSPNSLKGDRTNIALLLCLYTLQGIPLGLSAAIPMILQNRGVTYKQQAEFSLVTWPFSLKLLWAPLVDSIFSKRIGRRKTWLIPTQYLIGCSMLLLSVYVNQWLGNENGKKPNIEILTLLFFLLNFLAATQDIAVDGWALTMLKKQNVGHASTCNSIGQTAGYFLSYVLFMALESSSFCNMYLRTVPETDGIVTLPGFLYFWGWIFIIITTLVAIFKREKNDYHHDGDIQTAYKSLKDILSLKPIQILVVILLTCRIGFSSTDGVMALKLVEAGIPKERLGLLAVPMIPVQLLLPLIISRYTNGPYPLRIFLKAIPYRLGFGFIAALLVWLTPKFVPNPTEGLPIFYVFFLIICYGLHQVCVFCMFVSIMAFFAKISDSTVGGTYMTLLNTVTNLGGNWPTILALYFVDSLTWKQCIGGNSVENSTNLCRSLDEKELCQTNGGNCVTTIDGFYIETIICFVIGSLWLLWGRRKINYLQNLNEQSWKLNKRRR